MRRLQLMGLLCFAMTSAAWASPGQAGPKQTGRVSSSLPAVQQRVVRRKAEVNRLEQDLARPESHSKQASRRLQEQDRAIAELQKQLQELQARPSAGQH
jgi:septal ring factor EnvC (AmiA/AmiB activator)